MYIPNWSEMFPPPPDYPPSDSEASAAARTPRLQKLSRNKSPGYPSPRPPTGQSAAVRRTAIPPTNWGQQPMMMSLCDNPLEPFLLQHPARDYAEFPASSGSEFPGVVAYSGYPCDIYENPSEHYAALGDAQGLLYPGSHDTAAKNDADRRGGGGSGSGGRSGLPPHQYFSECFFK